MIQTNDLDAMAKSLLQESEWLHAAATMKLNVRQTEIDESVRQMLIRAAELVRGAATLGKEANTIGLSTLARALLENLILILWVQVTQTHAKTLQEEGFGELVRTLQINLKNKNMKIMNFETGENVTAEFLANPPYKKPHRRKSVQERAREANVEDLYNILYRPLSTEMHGYSSLESSEDSVELAIINMQCIGAIAKCSGHAGVRWLLYRQRTDNKTLRYLLGLEEKGMLSQSV